MNLCNNRGSVLVITLVIMTVAISLSFYIIKLSREILRSNQMIMDKLQAKIEAESQFEKLIFSISTNRFASSYVHIINDFPEMEFPERLQLDGRPVKTDNSTIILKDTGSKLSVWWLSEYALELERLLILKNVETKGIFTVIDSFQDWIDSDDLKRLNGAERYFYKFEEGLKYSARNNSAVQSVEELKLIRGFHKNSFYEELKDYLVLSTSGTFNINTADEIMLSSIFGLPIDQARQLIILREKRGYISLIDLNNITGMDFSSLFEYISTFPTLALEIFIRSNIKEANEGIYSVVDFRPKADAPYIIMEYTG